MADSPEKEVKESPPVEDDSKVDGEAKVDLSAVNPLADLSEPGKKTKGRKSSKTVDEEKGNDHGKDKDSKPRSASLRELFSYATAFDYFLMILGFLAALVMGAGLPVSMWVFGEAITSFINYEITIALPLYLANATLFAAYNATAGVNTSSVLYYTANVSDNSLNCSVTQPLFDAYHDLELSCVNNTLFNQIVGNDTNEVFNVVLNVTETNCTLLGDVVTSVFSSASSCLDDSGFIAEINMWVIYFVIVASGMLVFGYIQISTYQISSERQVFKMRLAYYSAILRQDIGWFDVNPSGEVCSRLADDLVMVQAGLADKLALLFQWVSTFFFGFAVAFAIEWRLTLLLLGMSPFLVIVTGITTKLYAAFTSAEQKQYASAGAVAEEVLSSVRTVVAFGGEYNEVERYKSHLGSATRVGIKKGVTLGASLGLLFFIMFVTYAVSFWFGGWLVAAELADGGKILSAFFSVLVGAFALGQAAPSSEALSTALGSAGAIFDAIKRQPPIDSSSDEGVVPTEEVASLQMKNVNFNYPARPDIRVLKDFNLQVDVGQTVALVGQSGCGKSTVVQLLQRFYDIDSGEISIGKYPVKDLNLKYLRSIIGVVSQEPVLFDTTVVENIRFGRQDATMEEIEAAAKDANVHDFIKGLPNGYDTLVGERGTQLSGGQKQRVAIARALLRQPKILLLDEATSALDSESESLVQAALEKASHGRTTIVIAHRLSTIQNADCIMCVDDGEVIEVGTHSELMKKEGLYFDMVTSQSRENADEGFMLLKKENQPLEEGQPPEKGEELAVPAMIKSPSKQFSKQFSRQFSGEASTVQAETKTKTDKQKQAEWDKELKEVPLVKLVALNAPEWWMVVLGISGAVVNGAMFPLFAILFGDVLSVFAMESGDVLSAIHLPAGIFLVLAVTSGLGNFVKVCFFTIAGEKLTSRLREKVFRAYLRQEMGWFDQERNSTGSLTTRLAEDAAHVKGATGSHLAILLETFISLFLALGIAFGYSWIMSIVVLGLVPFVAVSTMIRTILIHSHVKMGKTKMVVAGKLAVDSIENIRVVTSLNLQNTFRQKYKKEIIKPHRSGLMLGMVEGAAYGFSQCVMFFGYAVTFRFGAYLVSLDTDHVLYTSFPDVFRSLFAVVFGAMAIGQASAFAPNYTRAKLSSKRIFALLDREPEIDNYSEEGQKIENFEGAIEFQDVNFNYPSRPDVPILQDISLAVKPGQTLALVGPSGCGKSTTVSLLDRFYDPKSGDVCVDGMAIPGLNLRWLRSQIGIVSQEPVLFDISIADNIRYGSHHRPVTDEEVIEAAKAANIDEFVQSLPKGYSTNVGDKGTQLSGGQKQRVAIARALIRNPRILLLDEATSALDSESERVVQEALDKARRGRTSIVIAHRLSTIRNADCIIVMTKGKVLEMGTHAELLAKGGLYAQLHNLQQLNKED